jgi:hypothetical protein
MPIKKGGYHKQLPSSLLQGNRFTITAAFLPLQLGGGISTDLKDNLSLIVHRTKLQKNTPTKGKEE